MVLVLLADQRIFTSGICLKVMPSAARREAPSRHFAIDHFRPGVREYLVDGLQHGVGQHIATCRAPVAQNAVVKQVIGCAVVDAQQRLVECLIARLAGLEAPDVWPEWRTSHPC